MFALILTIISIILVAAITLAAIYYGGSTYSHGSEKALIAKYTQRANQIVTATVLYENANNGALPPTLSALVPTYLASVPSGPWNLQGASTVFVANGQITKSQCQEADQAQGLATVPTCSSDSSAICCAGPD